MITETIAPVPWMDESRLSVASNATYEIEHLCGVLIEQANKPSAGFEGVLFRGLAARIGELNGAIMDLVGSGERATEEITQRCISSPIPFRRHGYGYQ
ncbi:hypothetical protein [Pusillimonas sp.]|uniref:hypothetical protein n=1 Tax=Pusillimonas sp. TaxID=3040095 RepID=UPI0037C66F8B